MIESILSKMKGIKVMKVDIVCPLYLAEDYIEGFLERLQRQKNVEIDNVIFPITEEGSVAEVANKISKAGYRYFLLSKDAFSHSLTREKAIFEYCENDIVIMMSQDVILLDDYCLFELASHVTSEVVYAYGRQICSKKTIEHYTRLKNYSEASSVVTKADIERLQIKAFGSSDAFAAYYRPAFLRLNSYDNIHMMFNEDMYYAKKILEAGYKKAYVATAVVEHSHKLTLNQLYKRYYATGEWFKEHREFDNYKTTDTGLQLAIFVFKAAIKDFNVPVLIRFVPDMLSRYLGMRNGKMHN
ncbi:hypothetical protein E4K67_01690 [Desulfosporosinus fructosivorans]|uniref:Glycosyltransferase n=2 Tax=Desulfosporosinus fructosivorans TaxID=2018669 RepID=A0A4Z0RCP1_9FIRM|nr:hypothetical protein E4K67_01690 [Desulfosporosinus fructosivorans]